jgi:opacity protein-like surface antigen
MRAFFLPLLILIGVHAILPLPDASAQASGQPSLDLRWSLHVGATSGHFQGNASAFAHSSFQNTDLPAKFDGSRTGVRLGLGLQTPLTEWLGVRTALNYIQKGGVVERQRIGPADGLVIETATFRFDYVDMPIFTTLRLPFTPSNLRPQFFVGPTVEMNLRSDVQMTRRRACGGSENDVYYRGTSQVASSRFALSAVGGVEVMYTFSSTRKISVDLQYHLGLTDVLRTGDEKVRTKATSVGVRYLFSR